MPRAHLQSNGVRNHRNIRKVVGGSLKPELQRSYRGHQTPMQTSNWLVRKL